MPAKAYTDIRLGEHYYLNPAAVVAVNLANEAGVDNVSVRFTLTSGTVLSSAIVTPVEAHAMIGDMRSFWLSQTKTV
jgi:hypothetical protein